ncbi:MAG: hypothetical protein ABI880_07945 [Acidobacteriota bacterium]
MNGLEARPPFVAALALAATGLLFGAASVCAGEPATSMARRRSCEWQSVQAGADIGATYKWFVAVMRQDSPSIPEGWYSYSNVEPMTTRPIEAVITWSPVGADVDLHLANPSGTDIADYNRTT